MPDLIISLSNADLYKSPYALSNEPCPQSLPTCENLVIAILCFLLLWLNSFRLRYAGRSNGPRDGS